MIHHRLGPCRIVETQARRRLVVAAAASVVVAGVGWAAWHWRTPPAPLVPPAAVDPVPAEAPPTGRTPRVGLQPLVPPQRPLGSLPPAPEPPAHASTAARPDVVFDNVRLVRTNDGKTEEVDALLMLGPNGIVVTPRHGTAAARTMPYRSVAGAVYSRSTHWLTLEGGGEAIVLRLDKNNYRAILPELEVRAGAKIERASGE